MMPCLRVLVCAFLCLFYAGMANSHNNFIEIIQASKPYVVQIEVVRKKKIFGSRRNKEQRDALGKYAEFYKDEFNSTTKSGKGSGFVLNSHAGSGNVSILTAAHVVQSSSQIKVKFSNGDKKKGVLVWVDRKHDVALIRVNYEKIKGGQLNLSSTPPMDGEPIVAISGAFGISLSSSVGIISAQNVDLTGFNGRSLLQTDAPINPGSSGAPLINLDGQVVGLISSIYSKTGTFSGAAFAVPSERLSLLIDQYK